MKNFNPAIENLRNSLNRHAKDKYGVGFKDMFTEQELPKLLKDWDKYEDCWPYFIVDVVDAKAEERNLEIIPNFNPF